jgi:hypothetical protein
MGPYLLMEMEYVHEGTDLMECAWVPTTIIVLICDAPPLLLPPLLPPWPTASAGGGGGSDGCIHVRSKIGQDTRAAWGEFRVTMVNVGRNRSHKTALFCMLEM